MPGASNARFSCGMHCKNGFAHNSFFIDFGVVFLETLGTVILVFVALKKGLNINGFSVA